jgi:hypothetical protein
MLYGIGSVHSMRVQVAGCPPSVRSKPESPKTSTSAATSTRTSIVHFPEVPRDPVIVARRIWSATASAISSSPKPIDMHHRPPMPSLEST